MSYINVRRELVTDGMSCSAELLKTLLENVTGEVHFVFHPAGADPRDRDHLSATVTV